MTKAELLNHLTRCGDTDALEVADAFGLPYSTAAMALLRLLRQGLVIRRLDPEEGVYWYALTERGTARFVYVSTSKSPDH